MRWLDCSSFTGQLAPSFVDAVVANGVEGLAVQLFGGTPGGTGLNPYRFQQLDLARSRGLRLAGYSWPPSTVPFAIVETPGYEFDFVALDVEAGAGMTRLDVDAVRALGGRPVKYASPHTWSTIMGNTSAFADVDTWLATYFQQGWKPWEQVSGLGLGDGARTMMVQIQGTTTLLDDQFDLNVADRAWFTSIPEEDTDMFLVQTETGALYLVGSTGKVHLSPEAASIYGAVLPPPTTALQAEMDAVPDALLGPSIEALQKDVTAIKAALVDNPTGAHTHEVV